jgi:hypothetical protein
MSSSNRCIKPIAKAGPSAAPIVSSDWRSPNAAPLMPEGVRSATSASRGAPRIPLPMRSRKRATSTSPIEFASGNSGFVAAARL